MLDISGFWVVVGAINRIVKYQCAPNRWFLNRSNNHHDKGAAVQSPGQELPKYYKEARQGFQIKWDLTLQILRMRNNMGVYWCLCYMIDNETPKVLCNWKLL